MSDQHKAPSLSNLGVLRQFSLSNEESSSNSTPNGVNSFRDVVAASGSNSPQPTTKSTAFRRLKSQLIKRRKSSKPQTSEEYSQSIMTTEDSSVEATPDAAPAGPSCDTSSENAPSWIPREKQELNEVYGLDKQVTLETSHGSIESDTSHPMSANALARRIQMLISSVPPFIPPFSSVSQGVSKTPDLVSPEPGANTALADSKFLSLLSSTSVMNGSISKGRESVWAILERLGHTPSPSKLDDKDKDEADASLDENIEVSSVMICCPLQPAEDSEVEIARSEVVSIDIEMEKATPTAIEKLKERGAALHLWPLGQGKGKERSDNTNTNSPPREQPKTPRTKVKDVRVWHPSRTKVSLQAAWWGYRIYLPPPVMRVLSDKTLEAAKRAAMITAALTWLVSHIPTTMLPPQLRTVVEVVKGIVPILGYVGGFIAWSWNTVQSFDKGQGVILSATWLLPVALVPGTWFYTEPPNDSSNDSEGLSATSLPPSPPPKDPPTQPVR